MTDQDMSEVKDDASFDALLAERDALMVTNSELKAGRVARNALIDFYRDLEVKARGERENLRGECEPLYAEREALWRGILDERSGFWGNPNIMIDEFTGAEKFLNELFGNEKAGEDFWDVGESRWGLREQAERLEEQVRLASCYDSTSTLEFDKWELEDDIETAASRSEWFKSQIERMRDVLKDAGQIYLLDDALPSDGE